jgi:WD40 repeat protein
VPNFTSKSVVFSYDGKSIVSAWNDGVIRAFTPLTGKLIYAIPNAHNKGCTAVALTKSGKILVSGGVEVICVILEKSHLKYFKVNWTSFSIHC